LVILTAACSQADDAPAESEGVASPGPTVAAGAPPVAAPRSVVADDGGRSRYTRLSDCRLLRSVPEEAGFTEHECRGEGDYRLRLTESDLRQNVVVVPPDGEERSLALPALANGAFSSVGDTIEWRGDAAGDSFTPDALIMRHSVMENPDPNVPETAYLVVARLGSSPCVVARIVPGPRQNRLAREAADRGGNCLETIVG
jgi:hypothetical protein